MCDICNKLPEDCVYKPSLSYSSLDELISNHSKGFPGETYLVNGDVHVWIADKNAWINVGPRPETAL